MKKPITNPFEHSIKRAKTVSSNVTTRKKTWCKFILTITLASANVISLDANAIANTGDYSAPPPFIANTVKPNVVVALDISGSMKIPAYQDSSGGSWSSTSKIFGDFNENTTYFGYFTSGSKYSYDKVNGFFYEDASGGWDGNFLNWATMRRMDVVRKVLVGGKIEDRAGSNIAGYSGTSFIIEGQNEPEDRTFRKAYSGSSALTNGVIPDGATIQIAAGKFSALSGLSSNSVSLSEDFEIGQVDLNCDKSGDNDGDYASGSNWLQVSFKNTYTTIPRVVVTGLSFNGGDPVHARVRNVTLTGFDVRLEEWEYRDINHTTETITYLAAEQGLHTIKIGTEEYLVQAGQVTTNDVISDEEDDYERQYLHPDFTSRPLVFAGVATNNSERPVVALVKQIASSGEYFDVFLQNEEEFFDEKRHPADEDIHWIAMEPLSGTSAYAPDGISAVIQSGLNESTSSNFNTINFASNFSNPPILAIGSWSKEEKDTAYPRYRNLGTSSFQAFMEEEKSDDNETTHETEKLLYLAVEASSEFNIRIRTSTEPVGVIQQNSGSMRFGVAVYNYDHSLTDTTSIYNGNKVHGGTLHPCFPDISKPVDERTNFDICLETHVKSPLANIIQVIEEHPLIWGSTPIGETLYDIKGYFEQKDYNRNGHTQWYDNGTENSGANRRNSYEVSDEWDPYYYDELGTTSPCAKSFILHFNDGAPFRDFDGDASQHPVIANDGVGAFGENDKLDDLALELRQNDCRATGDKAIEGHQEIISYYVLAALGESESNDGSTRRMREAAANGGFEDDDDDNQPTPAHPDNFISYINSNNCPVNEWDKDGDCNPDTFYFANDGERLVTELNDAFSSIVARLVIGGASSVISASRSGEGVVVNAVFEPLAIKGGDQVSWTGDVHALFIDDAGRLRQSSDTTLDAESTDKIIDFCSKEVDNVQIVRIKESSSNDERPTAAQQASCSDSVYSKELDDINYLWNAASWLSALTDEQAVQQRSYGSTSKGRYIITGRDINNDGLVQASEQVTFETTNFTTPFAGLLADDEATAAKIVEYTRGKDFDDYRSRTLNGKQRRLGDVIYSTPTIVGRPSENIDVLYNSKSYKDFILRYQYRRQVIYAGANDGMLHAFNGGWFDDKNQKLEKAKGQITEGETKLNAAGSSIAFDLGAELWAYAPYNTLRHLEYLTNPSYGSSSSDHINFVDLKPKVFDAKVFDDDADHPGGWGTILVAGMRLGGGEVTVDMDLSSGVANRTLTSSYSFFDITNPDVEPKLLLEFTHPDLGFTTSTPAVITKGTDNEGNGDWFIMLGSGADTNQAGFEAVKSTQNARLFLLDLKSIASGSAAVMVNDFGTNGILTIPESNSFISDIVSVDYGLDNFTTDVVYFGTTAGDATDWSGKLYRILVQEKTNDTQVEVSNWATNIVYDANNPITVPVSVAVDSQQNRWIYFGSGRYFNTADNLDETQYDYFGLKEQRNNDGSFAYTTISDKIVDVTTTLVTNETGVLINPPSISPALSSNNIKALESRMKIYTGANQVNGWKRQFNNNQITNLSLDGERTFGAATLLGGTLTFTSFDPDVEACAIEGQSLLYVLNAFTGTAGLPQIIGEDGDSGYNRYVIDIGSSPAATPSLHRGQGYKSDNGSGAIVQTSDGTIVTLEQANPEQVSNGEASWRQLQ